ncbi:MAG: PAS domain S-box protein [Gallionella sp.]|nr:PAS domain S-box protein [Gallionella sp.]
MSDTVEKLRYELQAARRTIDELQDQLENRETTHRLTTLELEESRSALLFMLEDLEAGRKKIEQAHQEWMAALDVVNDPIFLHDKEFRILRCNKAYQQRAGVPFEQIIGQPYYAIFPKADTPLPCCLHAMEKVEEEKEEEVAIGEAIYRSRSFSVHDKQGAHLYSVHILEDITESKRAAEALSGSETRFRNLVETTSDWIWEVDENAVYTYVSPRVHAILGYEPAEVLGKTPFELMPAEEAKRVADIFGSIVAAKKSFTNIENTNLHKDGHLVALETSAVPVIDPEGKFCGYRGIDRDITERKRAEDELQLRAQLLDSASDTIFVVDFNGNFVYLNEAAWKTRGYTRDELMGINLHVLDTPKYEKLIESKMRHLKEKGWSIFETEHRCKDGSVMPVEISARLIEAGGRKLVLSVARDITERKQAEIALNHANRALATLGAVNRNLVHATNEDELLQAICQAIVRQRGYRLAWVGYVQHDENKSIKIMAHAGHDEGYLDATQITWAENERGKGPTGRAIRSGATQLCQDIANDPLNLPWRDAALQRGYAASIALPLLNRDNTVFGTLTVYAEEVNAFSPGEISLLEEMAGDLAFGVRTLHTRQQRDNALVKNQEQLVQLHKSLEDTVRAMAAIVEMRDPYTAGHQARVADLATAIAKQIGLPEEQVHGIHLAGTVHDLGKINVPAEILSKPGKITDIERSLIKIHPQAGYDILKGIDFPWPIAQMVLQHHERFDGSGYPQGLKGDQIIIEARILCVADVVEAISAHRPYRAGLGIEAALEEITKNCGVFYDPQVVDACLTLFRERGYSFK